MDPTRSPRRHLMLPLVLALGVAGLAQSAIAADTAVEVTPGAHVVHTRTGPTGYSVRFVLAAPDATSVRIKGTWSFASEASIADDPTNASPITAHDWQPSDYPLQSPNTPGEGWPVTEMTQDEPGLWSTVVPLPSGVFDYQFYVDCAAPFPSVTGCTATTDPTVPAWNTSGSVVRWSQVYVPSDPEFGTDDLSFLAQAPADEQGSLEMATYPTSSTTSGSNNAAVYLPAGYDPHRPQPYPLLVLSHGGGENETVWSTRGRLPQVVDNLTAEGLMQPTVVVMPNGSGVASYTSHVTDVLLPWVADRYHVSTDPHDRAFAGTSAFGTQANNFLFGDTDAFGYVGIWSPAAGAPTVEQIGAGFPAGPPTGPQYQDPALLTVPGIHLAIGEQDLGGNAPMLTTTLERIALQNAGVPFRYFTGNGGHTFTFWREALRDFLTEVAFRTTATAVSAAGGEVVATVTPVTTEPVPPGGTVQFLVDGAPLGEPVAVSDGTATLRGQALAWTGRSLTARYSGDVLYDASAGDPVVLTAAPAELLSGLSTLVRELREDRQVTGPVARRLTQHVADAQRFEARGRTERAVTELERLVRRLDVVPASSTVTADADAALRAAVATVRAALGGA